MYVIGASYLEGASLDLTGGTEISSVLNLTLWFHNTLIHSIVLLPTNKHLTQTNLEKWHFNYQIHIYSLSGLYYNIISK